MDAELRALAEAARGFMPADEGLALHDAAAEALDAIGDLPIVEVGTYCGKSSIYLGAAALARGATVVTIDHHRGSEENQAGWEHHEPDLVDDELGVMDTLPTFRRAMFEAGLESTVTAVVGDSPGVASWWSTPAAMVFIDGGHGDEPAATDYRCWAPRVAPGGLLAIHDVFPDPADGGRPPYERIYLPALESGEFEEIRAVGSLRVLRRLPA